MVVGEFTQETNLLVIGGGPGGYSAAFRAAELGLETVIVDARETIGGVCLHAGCVPSKTLLSIADAIASVKHASSFGVQFASPKIDPDAIRAWVGKTISTLSEALVRQSEKLRVEHISGEAVFEDSKHVAIRGSEVPRVKFKKAIIAAGSSPIEHPACPFDGSRILNPGEALALHSIPGSLLIVGSSYMAVELASIYAALGSKVTLVDEGEQMLPDADADLVKPMLKRLGQSIAAISTKTRLSGAKAVKAGVDTRFEGSNAPKQTRFDQVIIAIGQRPNTDSLGLEHTQVKLDEHGFIKVNEQMKTDDSRILAVGDVTGEPLLADKAIHQGRIAAEAAAGWGNAFDARAIPVIIFTDPQIAWCGLTEHQAKSAGVEHEVVKIPWGFSGRAVGMGRSEGLTKLIIDPSTKLILGVGIAGSGAAEMIGEGALAIEMGAVVDDLASTIHPHPTMSELIGQAAISARPPAQQ